MMSLKERVAEAERRRLRKQREQYEAAIWLPWKEP
jgi:hypothetical protein